MQSMQQIRTWHLGQMQNAINTTKVLVAGISQADATTYRDGGDGWTVAEVVGHLLDFEDVFMGRAQMTLEQDTPDLPFPDHDALVIENDYNNKNANEIVEQWIAVREEHLALLESVPDDQWERPANHPTRGNFTLNDQLFLTVWHDMNHLEQIAHIVLEK